VRALGYARVSIPEKRIENRVQGIERFCRENGLELIKVFQDIGVSGSKRALKREGFK